MQFKLPIFRNEILKSNVFFINNKILALYFTLIFKRRLFLTSRIFVYKTYNLVYVGSEDNILLPMQYWSSHH